MSTSRLLPLVLALAACPAPKAAPPEPPEIVDIVPPGPPPLPFDPADDTLDLVQVLLLDAGQKPLLEPQGTLLRMPLDASLRVELWQRLADVRVRLVTLDDRLVPFELESGTVVSAAYERDGPGGTWFTLNPTDPLQPDTGFEVRFEGEVGPKVTDDAGRAYQDLTLSLRTVAPPPAPGPED